MKIGGISTLTLRWSLLALAPLLAGCAVPRLKGVHSDATPTGERQACINPLVGNWVSEDPDKEGVTKVSIGIANNAFVVQEWGKCVPTDCYGGSVIGEVPQESTVSIRATWVDSFATSFQTFTLTDKGLAVRGKSIFTDGSGREIYEFTDNLVRGDRPITIPTPPHSPRASHHRESAVLYLNYYGQPVSRLTDVQPTFWFRTPDGKGTAPAKVVREGEAYVVSGLAPGTYGVAVSIDAQTDNPKDFPGDYRAWFELPIKRWRTTIKDVPVEKLIHLTKPQDNGLPMQDWSICLNVPELSSPVTFAWEPLGLDGVRYSYNVMKVHCNPFSNGDVVAFQTTLSTSIVVDLPESAEGEAYIFDVRARRKGWPVGSFMTHGTSGGFGWDYRFRVSRAKHGTDQ